MYSSTWTTYFDILQLRFQQIYLDLALLISLNSTINPIVQFYHILKKKS